MKKVNLIIAAVMLGSMPVSASSAVMERQIRMMNIFYDDYTEVGRWIYYCDGSFEQIGTTGYRQEFVDYGSCE